MASPRFVRGLFDLPGLCREEECGATKIPMDHHRDGGTTLYRNGGRFLSRLRRPGSRLPILGRRTRQRKAGIGLSRTSPNVRRAIPDRSIYDKAGAMWRSLTLNHPFLDGNKRMGFLCCWMFLCYNGYLTTAPQEDIEEICVLIAAGNPAPPVDSLASRPTSLL